MDATAFWQVIGEYNKGTWLLQIMLLLLLVGSVALTYRSGKGWICKCALACINLFIAIGFFCCYGTKSIQLYFALPLYIAIGLILLFDAWRNPEDKLQRPSLWQCVFILLYLIYPLVSSLCGHAWPQIVMHIMPCPVVTITIALYVGYSKLNRWLLVLLSIWGLTGVKAIIFNAYEDLILLAAGIYCLLLLVNSFRKRGY